MNASLWARLRAGRGPFALDPASPGVDPVWLWADATQYRDHLPDGLKPGGGVWCVVERSDQKDCTKRWRSELLTARDWPNLRDGEGFGARMQCIELAMPVVPERPRPSR